MTFSQLKINSDPIKKRLNIRMPNRLSKRILFTLNILGLKFILIKFNFATSMSLVGDAGILGYFIIWFWQIIFPVVISCFSAGLQWLIVSNGILKGDECMTPPFGIWWETEMLTGSIKAINQTHSTKIRLPSSKFTKQEFREPYCEMIQFVERLADWVSGGFCKWIKGTLMLWVWIQENILYKIIK